LRRLTRGYAVAFQIERQRDLEVIGKGLREVVEKNMRGMWDACELQGALPPPPEGGRPLQRRVSTRFGTGGRRSSA